MIRVLIADDHEVVRDGVRSLLEIQADMLVVGEAPDGQVAVRLAQEERPDVVLMDLRMPRLDGLGAIRAIRQTCPEVTVVILTTYDDDGLILQGLRAGARGYLLKDASRETILEGIRAAARGETLLSPEVLATLVTHLGQPGSTPDLMEPGSTPDLVERRSIPDPAPLPPVSPTPISTASPARSKEESPLTERELEVLQLAAEGYPSKEIALRLGISERTVKAHLTSIYTKLNVSSRAEAVARGLAVGFLLITGR